MQLVIVRVEIDSNDMEYSTKLSQAVNTEEDLARLVAQVATRAVSTAAYDLDLETEEDIEE